MVSNSENTALRPANGEKIKKGFRRGIEGPVAQTILLVIILIILLLTLLPVLITMVMSVKSSQDIMAYPIWTLPQTGWYFSNYREAFSVLSSPMLNTILIDLISTFVTLLLSCFIAIWLPAM